MSATTRSAANGKPCRAAARATRWLSVSTAQGTSGDVQLSLVGGRRDRTLGAENAPPSWPPAGAIASRPARTGSAARRPPASVATAVATTTAARPQRRVEPARDAEAQERRRRRARPAPRRPASPPRAPPPAASASRPARRAIRASASRPVTTASATTCRGAWPARCRASGCGSAPAPEREEQPVAVVAQVEHARETDGRVGLLAPSSPSGAWRRQQVVDAARRPPDARPRPPPSARAAPRRSGSACSPCTGRAARRR